MDDKLIFLPVLVQVLLTLYAYILLSIVKKAAVRNGEVDESRRALHGDAWPESVIKVNNNISNQLHVPVLFYVLVLTLFSLRAVDLAAHIVAWGFVATRLGHAYVHLGRNHVPTRRRLFTIGVVLVLVLAVLVGKAIVMA